MKSIYEMELHETISCMPFEITRVPGGWLYSYANNPCALTMTFVPFHNEFDDRVIEPTPIPSRSFENDTRKIMQGRD